MGTALKMGRLTARNAIIRPWELQISWTCWVNHAVVNSHGTRSHTGSLSNAHGDIEICSRLLEAEKIIPWKMCAMLVSSVVPFPPSETKGFEQLLALVGVGRYILPHGHGSQIVAMYIEWQCLFSNAGSHGQEACGQSRCHGLEVEERPSVSLGQQRASTRRCWWLEECFV